MKLVIPVLTFCGFAHAQNEIATASPVEEMEMSWVDWATEMMPGFKATTKYYQYVNSDFDIKVKYWFQEDQPKFLLETPWFSESWTLDMRTEDMMSFNYNMEMDELKGHMDFVQGMDELIQIKINDDGSEKEQNKGTHWMQKIDMKMQDKNEDMPWKMIWQRMISTQFDKKIPELYVATEYEEKMQFNDMKAQMKSSHKVKYDDDNMWTGQQSQWNGKMDDGNATKAVKGKFNVDLDEYTSDDDSCVSKMSWNMEDQINDMTAAGSSELSILNKQACMFAMTYPMKMLSPHNSMEMTEDDIKEWLVENTDSEMTAEELQAQYEYINSQTQTLSNGLYEMTDMCKINMKSTYPSMEDMTETESCEIDFQFRNLLDMSLTWNGQEIVKFTNAMVGLDFQYTFSYMGYEAYSMSPMTWYTKVMADMKQVSMAGFMMYKEHEHYITQFMEVLEMEDEQVQMNEIMNHIQVIGNWDYVAAKMKVIVNDLFESMKSEKCGMTLKEHAAEYGYFLAADGEMAMLKEHDMKIQFMEYLMMNNVSMSDYMYHQALMFASENYQMEMDQEFENDHMDMMALPEFVVVEHTVEEMNARIAFTCDSMHQEFINMANQCHDMMVTMYVDCRDTMVNFADMAVQKINDKTQAEALIDEEFVMIMAKREGEWMTEFDICWTDMWNCGAMENMEDMEDMEDMPMLE
jgi:hypothetical protein